MTERNEIRKKREILRELYGGSLSLDQLKHELGCTWEVAKEFGRVHRLEIHLDRYIRYDTDELARVLVQMRGAQGT